ncbi:hypothetical protein [Enterococcus caccae]|uniref:Uncharacterized protein n=1 Tax=Enterococcus caccae ATCC BAA-1240 TaxID=1158612 RepID=R3WD80_9ENTE|nr:hypothetical protein [Enterococcus caccae]EOL45851.1 hypothetical protein UC7_01648 [Enterococcus caccae ATCC BAA-1240]EOT61047.1 hypothetical protein I580_01949 [Enterococcus caccae ATCC BAA-1240]OJG27924.1 hypothetical protein RU98_GL002133 [Enterococcus caccae]
MLNPYFAFGVPVFLLFLYIVFAIIRKKSKLHYIGFVLLLIASFMMVFSFQVLQGLWSLDNAESSEQLANFHYSPELLWAPFILGGILVIINLWRGTKRIQSFRETSTHKK